MVIRTPVWHFGQRCMTFETWIGASFSRIPPWTRCPRGFVCRLTKLTFSTIRRFSSRSTFNTRPVLPRSSPAITITWSFLANCDMASSDHLGSQRDDLHELALPELPRDRPEDARS